MRRIILAAAASASLALVMLPNMAAASAPPACPSASPNHGKAQPCGKSGSGSSSGSSNSSSCPAKSKNPGKPRPCGKAKGHKGGGGSTPPSDTDCGPSASGDQAPGGPLSSGLYGAGTQINNGGGSPLGTTVQFVACGVDALSGGKL